jgi:hypothetical protein
MDHHHHQRQHGHHLHADPNHPAAVPLQFHPAHQPWRLPGDGERHYNGPIDQFTGDGAQGSTSTGQQAYIAGPNFAASLSAGAGLWNTDATFAPASANSLAGTPSLLTISSKGADGANPGSDKHPGGGSYNAGAGGNVAITHNATLPLSVANLSTPSGDVIPPGRRSAAPFSPPAFDPAPVVMGGRSASPPAAAAASRSPTTPTRAR